VSRAKIVITGVKEVDARLRALGPKLANKIARKALRDEMKAMKADVAANTPVDSGATAASVKLQAGKRSRSRVSVEVVMYDGTAEDGRYISAFLEFGTSEMEGAGMFRRAYDANKDVVREGIIQRVKEGIEKEA
jgi:HK97 gp10 family phage protein